jgi:hypothetical protein
MGVSNENKYLSHDGLSTVWAKVKEYTDDKARKLVNITYSELVNLRKNNRLIPGQQYRIIDYVTTTIQKDTISAEHPFDIIVTADSKNTLNENARAIQHEGDEYFKDCDLAAWEIKYSVENSAKYAWAAPDNGKIQTLSLNILGYSGEPVRVSSSDMYVNSIDYYCWKIEANDLHVYTDTLNPTSETALFSPEVVGYENGKNIYEMVVVENAYFENISTNVTPGKGVIYYMKDEWGNELPYDFKNIVYKKDSKRVKVVIEYDYNDRFKDKAAVLVYSDDRDIIIYDDLLEKDIKYYAWRVFDTDGIATGICYTQTPYDCITSSTTFYEYIPPTEEEVKAYIESMSLVEGIAEGIGGDKPLIGLFVELTNFRIIGILKNLKQYTFGDEYSDISDITDYSLNTVESRSVKNNIIKPLISNGKYTLNGNVFTGANNNIVLNNCPKVDKSSLTYETAKDIKNTDDTEFAKVYGADRDKSEVMESYEMGFNDTKNACLEALGYGYGSGGSGGSGSSFVVDIPTGNFHYDTYLTPMDVVFANANGDKLITKNLSEVPMDYEPIGVVVIPASHDVYGTGECGVISLIELKDMPNIQYSDRLGIDNQWMVFTTDNTSNDDIYYAGRTSGYLPSDDFNGQQSYVDPKSYYYYDGDYEYMISPYLGEDKNDKYVGEGSSSVTYSFDGKERTNILSSHNYDIAEHCCDYNTIGTQKNDWYLPTVAELGYAMVRKKSINNTLDIIKSYFGIETELLLNTYETSTISSYNYTIDFYYGAVAEYLYERSFGYARPMYRFKP